MNFYEFTKTFTLQGNVQIKVFDTEGNEKENRFFRDMGDFDIICTDTEDLEEYEVTYMYANKSADGAAWLVVELSEAE